ncbi:nuclear transport factor 2-like protein [Maribacter antarcticus]|uniref:nuclear transport factor 2 family protein n=1 Tax=Maribacter antarcticus TaxID=505250 RepID=UPI00056950ED|nr:nuclear transport factor 2 family protein [Maribacter antarcticus]
MRTLKKIVVGLCTLFLIPIGIGAQESEVTLEFDNAATAQQIVQKYINALQMGDVTTMNSQLADTAIIYGLGDGIDSLNVTQHKEYYTNSTATFKHVISNELYLPVKVVNNWNEGEWVLAWGVNTVTDKETGNSFPINYHTASMVQNGKIVVLRYYYDVLSAMTSQGYTLTPPSKKKL